MNAPRTAAALVIGNELLTGKVDERNLPVLARALFDLGIALRRVVICADDVDTIVEDLHALRRHHDLVFTSGGVGPTHDDVTLRAVASAFGRRLVRSPPLADLLRGYFGERLTDEHLRMADVPEGAELVTSDRVRWPLLKIHNIYILPGQPEVFERKVALLRHHLGADRPFITRAVHSSSEEGEIAALLEEIGARFPDIQIGSYPRWGGGPVRVAVTFDGRDGARVDLAAEALEVALTPARLVDMRGPAMADPGTGGASDTDL
jgi:molybdenum cofactor synthesis domain-containing protein